MKGLPGSGKSFLAKQIRDDYQWCAIFSTDNYWFRPDGKYDWNPRLVGEAHAWNFEQVTKFVSNDYSMYDTIIIDNTNIQLKEFRKYIDLIAPLNHEVVIAEPNTTWKFDVEECAKRNTHSVPKESIQRMLDRWENTEQIVTQLTKEGIKCSIYQEI